MTEPALTCPNPEKEPEDYVLNTSSCWITVGSISVNIRRDGDGARVVLYKLGDEDGDSLDIAEAGIPLDPSQVCIKCDEPYDEMSFEGGRCTSCGTMI